MEILIKTICNRNKSQHNSTIKYLPLSTICIDIINIPTYEKHKNDDALYFEAN